MLHQRNNNWPLEMETIFSNKSSNESLIKLKIHGGDVNLTTGNK